MKKIIPLAVLFCSLATMTIAQDNWQSMMDDRSANFFEIQADFQLYYDAVMDDQTTIPKGLGIKQFKRWEYYWESRVDENGNFPQDGTVLTEMQRYQEENADRSYETGTGDWQLVGPTALPTNGTGQPNGNGRVNCIAFHPTDVNTLYAGAPSGGFWKSTDNGASWTEHSAGLTRLGVSSIVIHPNSPNTIYIGTGDRDGGDVPGYGVWRTTDGGNTWSAHNAGMGNRTMYEILMDPSDPLKMIASGSGRIYRTIDGGTNWSISYSGVESFKDIAFHPTDPDIIYASGNDYYRSADNGVTWSQITSGVPVGTTRMALSVSEDEPDYVYLISGDGSGLEGVYRSTDSGLNFSSRATTPNLFGYDTNGGTGSQAWYDCVATGDPLDGDHITMGGINLWESFDGGSNWSIVTHWVGSGGNPAVHADQHVLEYSPHSGDLYNGNDGGVYYSSDAGAIWIDISSGLAIAQVYKIGVAQSVEDLVINGYQDNGTAISDGTEFQTEIGGDGMECIIDPLDETYMYGALYYGDMRRSSNGGASFSQIAGDGVNGITEDGAWVTPYTLDPNSTSRMFIGYRNIWRSDNVKAGTPTWTEISGLSTGATVRDIAVAPSNSDVVYMSRNSGSNFYRSNNATAGSPSWTDLDGLLPASSYPRDIAIDPADATHLFIALGNNIYESTDSGSSWIDYSGTLPNISVNTIIIDSNSPVEGMYLGNDVGVYYRDNTLSDWEPYSTGFPNLEVTELEIYSNVNNCQSVLFAATYGQGLWKSNLKDPGNLSPISCFESDAQDGCTGNVFTFTDNSSYTPTSWTWSITPNSFLFVGGTNANSQNPQVQLTAAGNYDISLTASNAEGSDAETKASYISVSNANPALGFIEDFESYATCGTASDCGTTVCTLGGSLWSNQSNGIDDDIDFRVDEGGTPSSDTGPSVDYNPGTGTGNYIYTEASSCSGQEAILVSECIDLDQSYDFIFAYHMLGTDMGELHLDISSAGAWQNDVTTVISGDQGTDWSLRTVDLSSFTGSSVRLRFRAITGNGFESDIVLDDFVFSPQSTCNPPTINTTVVDESCPAVADGSITVNTTGGSGAFTYSLDGGIPQTGNVFSGLTAGDYSIEVIVNGDAGCTVDTDVTLVISDVTPPSGILTSAGGSPINSSPVTFEITFSEDVTGLDDSDFNVSGGTVLNIIPSSPTLYSINITPSSSMESISVFLVAAAVSDCAGNMNAQSNTFNVIYDAVSAILSPVSISSSNADPSLASAGDVITIAFTTSETLSGTPTATINGNAATVSGSGTSWTATRTVTGSDPDGLVTYSISVQDLAGNNATVTAVTDSSSVTIISSGVANDDCSGAIELTPSIFGESAWQTFPLGSNGSGGCAGIADDDVWFSFIALSTNDLIIAQDPAGGYDAAIEVYSDCGVFLQCFENYAAGAIERALPGATPGNEFVVGNTYYFRVYDIAAGPSASTNVRVMVKTFEEGGLKSTSCDVINFDLSDQIWSLNDGSGQLYSNPVVGVSNYRFRFRETADGTTYNGGLDVTVEGPNGSHGVQLDDVPGLAYGNQYLVSVGHKVGLPANGFLDFYWSGLSAECTIGLEAGVPTTTLGAAFCPSLTNLYLSDQINAVPLLGADQYEFTFDGPNGPFVKYSSNYNVVLSTVGSLGNGLQYNNATYNVTVRARVNGEWSMSGASCMIGMQAQPMGTQLLASFCGTEVDLPGNSILTAVNVKGATNYQFKFSPLSGQTTGVLYRIRPTKVFQFANTTMPFEAGLYSVEVRAYAGETWGAFTDVDPDCIVNIVESGTMAPPMEDILYSKLNQSPDMAVRIYPNPNNGQQFRISLEGLDENGLVSFILRDIRGRTIESQQFAFDKKAGDFIWNTTGTLEKGMYIMEILSEAKGIAALFVVE